MNSTYNFAFEGAEEAEKAAENGDAEILGLAVRHRKLNCRHELLRLARGRLLQELLCQVRLLRTICEFDLELALLVTFVRFLAGRARAVCQCGLGVRVTRRSSSFLVPVLLSILVSRIRFHHIIMFSVTRIV